MDWKKIFSVFDGAINIEKSYKLCDQAIDKLKKYDKNPETFEGEKKAELEDTVKRGFEAANRILEKEGQKNWPGVFREMHENLAKMYMYEGKSEKAKEECEKLREFGQVGKFESEKIMKELNEREDSEGEAKGSSEEAPSYEETQRRKKVSTINE